MSCEGAHLYVTVRDIRKGQATVDDILSASQSDHGKISLLHLDLASLQSVRDCVMDFKNRSKVLNVLINNASKSQHKLAER